MSSAVAGPPALPLLGHLPWFLRDRAEFLLACHRRYGDVVRLRLGGPTLLVVAPDDVRHVLVGGAENYRKSPRVIGSAARRRVGVTILTTEGAAHRRVRAAVQPWFRRDALKRAAAPIEAIGERAVEAWCKDGVVDVVEEARRFSGEAVATALLGAGIARRLPELVGLLEARRAYVEGLFGAWPLRRQAPARRALDEILGAALRGESEGLACGSSELGAQETVEQVLAVLVAGYETVAVLLAWALYLVATDAAVLRACVEAEYAAQVIDETLRLYPPTWLFVRVAVGADRLPSGAAIPAGAKIYLSQYVSHRQARIYAEPDRFLPERFAAPRSVPPFAYFPFGEGVRSCVGGALAQQIATSVLVAVARRAELRLESPQPPRAVARLTLRPAGPIRVAFRARN